MDTNQSYKTAYTAAYARLIEQYEPKEKRFFDDAIVKYFFSNYISSLLKIRIIRKVLVFMYNIASIGLLGLQICRTKYIDDLLNENIKSGIQQVVILGTGFDTRPYRLQDISKTKVFEVDLPTMLNKKQAILEKFIKNIPDNIVYTPINFNTQNLDEILKFRGLDSSKPIFFIWEGVTQYITKEAVENTLNFISKSASGSRLVFTYILKSVIDGTSNMLDGESLVNLARMGDQSWIFGLDPSEVSEYIKQYNLMLIENIGASYLKENYLNPVGRKLDVSDFERIIYAEIL